MLHPESRCEAVTRIEVAVGRPQPGHLMLTYLVTGEIDALRLSPVAASSRADELWRHTCFEAFVRAASKDFYTELNFAPSTRWAAYNFDGYRSGMAKADNIAAPHIAREKDHTRFLLKAALDLPLQGTWHLGLAAVIEEIGGRKSYWALAHPPGQPDFHHSDCFGLEVPAA